MTSEPLKGLVFVVLAILLISCDSSQKNWKNKPVVKIDEFTLTTEEFGRRLSRKLSLFDALSAKESSIVKKAKTEIVEEFILEMIHYIWAKNNGVFVRKETLDEAIRSAKNSYPDELSFKRALANENISYEDWQKKLKFSLLQKIVFSKITESIGSIGDDELKTYYKTHKSEFSSPQKIKLRQIVLKTENNALRIENELNKGGSFSELAKKYSIAPESASGGDLGWIEKGTLSIYDQAFELPRGRRSKVLKSEYGFHILEVMDRQSTKNLKYDEAKAKIEKILEAQKQQDSYSSWIEVQLRNVKIFRDSILISALGVRTNE